MTRSSRVLVKVTLWVERINFIKVKMHQEGKKSSFSCANILVISLNRFTMRHMAQGLQLSQRLTQSLVLAPQLQQSLALLQAPTLELKALVEHEMEQNPVLEEVAETDAEMREKSTEDEA